MTTKPAIKHGTSIIWTHPSGYRGETWNPIRATEGLGNWYCRKISDGCEFCYASTMNAGPRGNGGMEYQHENAEASAGVIPDDAVNPYVRLDQRILAQPSHWTKPRAVFLCSMTDLFAWWVPDAWLEQIYQQMVDHPQHIFMVLTKRPQRMRMWLIHHGGQRFRAAPNIWTGVSVESNAVAWRANAYLAQIPDLAVRYVSAEPLLGPLSSLELDGIHWVIAGGESGNKRAQHERYLVERCVCDLLGICTQCQGTGWRPRPDRIDWVRDLRDRTQAAGIAFLHKQWGGPYNHVGGRSLDGRSWTQFPIALGSRPFTDADELDDERDMARSIGL